jgi:hypothetical protein
MPPIAVFMACWVPYLSQFSKSWLCVVHDTAIPVRPSAGPAGTGSRHIPPSR